MGVESAGCDGSHHVPSSGPALDRLVAGNRVNRADERKMPLVMRERIWRALRGEMGARGEGGGRSHPFTPFLSAGSRLAAGKGARRANVRKMALVMAGVWGQGGARGAGSGRSHPSESLRPAGVRLAAGKRVNRANVRKMALVMHKPIWRLSQGEPGAEGAKNGASYQHPSPRPLRSRGAAAMSENSESVWKMPLVMPTQFARY